MKDQDGKPLPYIWNAKAFQIVFLVMKLYKILMRNANAKVDILKLWLSNNRVTLKDLLKSHTSRLIEVCEYENEVAN